MRSAAGTQRLALRVIAGLALATITSACDTCNGLPSASIDAGDLHGLFDRDAGPTVSATTSRPSASVASSRVPAVREPPSGSCVLIDGEPRKDRRRTIGRPACRAGLALEWRDPDGEPRYACLYGPQDRKKPLPLVALFHEKAQDPTMMMRAANLLKLAREFDLTGDATRRGFLLLVVQGRALGGDVGLGARYDIEFAGDANVDVATVDHYVDDLIAQGSADRTQIYTMGMGHGGSMAATYAMLRPGRVAAFAAFAPETPKVQWACPSPPPPGLVVYRACDAVVPCEGVERWIRAREELGATTTGQRVNEWGQEEPNCAFKNDCGPKMGNANHANWPQSHEKKMLTFLAAHRLAPTP